MKLSTLSTPIHHKTIVYGEAKTGKTRLIARLAKHRKLFWFDTEQSLSALMAPDNLAPEYRENINYIPFRDMSGEFSTATALNRIFSFKPAKYCPTHAKIDCPFCKEFIEIDLTKLEPGTIVVLDSLTQLVTSWVAMISKGKPENYKFQFDDWAQLGFLGKRFLTNIQAAPLDIIVTSRAIEVELEDGSKKLLPEGGTRNFSATVPGFFDHVVFTQIRGKEHVCGSSSTYSLSALTGSRTNAMLEKATQSNYSPLELIYVNS